MKISIHPFTPAKKFTLAMPAQREILGIVSVPYSGSYAFRVEQPSAAASGSVALPAKDFSFLLVGLDEQFDKEDGTSFLGEVSLVIDPDADRPAYETFFVYGVRKDG